MVVSAFIVTANAQQLNLLPEVPEMGSNPHLATAFDGVKFGSKLVDAGVNGQDEIPIATLAYLHPKSPYKGKQAILDRLILLMDNRLQLWYADKNLGDHMFTFEVTYAYLALKTYVPDKIPSDKKEIWEAAIKKHTNYLISNNPKIYKEHIVGAVIANMDVWRMQSVIYGGLATGDTASARLGKSALEDCFTRTVLADGATHYAFYSNEVICYHKYIVYGATWYYLITGSQKMKDFIFKMINYIPLTLHNGGFGEFSTAPSWKPFYFTRLFQAALIMGYLTGDPYNYAIGKDATNYILLAFVYRSGLVGKKSPENLMLYDRNTLGPRARFGAWGMEGTTRDPSLPSPEIDEIPSPSMLGNSTFAGAYILNSSTGELNAAFHGTAPEVKIKKGVEDDWNKGKCWSFLTGVNGHSGVSKSNLVFGLATRYHINRTSMDALLKKSYTDWDGIQEWVYTPDRMLGLCEITTDKEKTAFGLAQRIMLVSHNGPCKPGDGKAQELKKVGTGEWNYGDLRIKTHDKSFKGKEESFYFGALSDYKGFDFKNDEGSVIITLHDEQSGNDESITYPAGTKRYALIEVTYKGQPYSSDVTRLPLNEGLNGFEFTEQSGRKIRMIHNYTDKPIDYTASMATPF